MNMRFEPARALSGRAARARRQVDLPPRRASSARWPPSPCASSATCTPPTPPPRSTAVRALGALVEVHGEEVVVRGTGLREAREPDGPIDVGNAGTLLRLLPGWLAAQEGCSFTLDGDESIRRRPVDRIVEPLRQMGAELDAARGASRRCRCAAPGCARSPTSSTVASAQVKSCVLLAALAADGATTVGEPARSRDHTERMLLGAGVAIHRNGATSPSSTPTSCCSTASRVPGDPSSAAFLIAAGVLVPGSRLLLARRRRQLDAHRLSAHPAAHARHRARRPRGGDRRAASPDEPVQRPRRRPRRARGHRRGGRRGAAGDRRAAARRAARLLRRGRDGGARARRSCASRSPTASPASSRGCAASAPTSRRPTTASPCAAAAGCAAARSTPAATTAWRCSAPSPGWPRARASRSCGMDAAAVSYPGFVEDLARLSGTDPCAIVFTACLPL